jgi:hypothetical protein
MYAYGNATRKPLCSYLYLEQAKISFFSLCFFFYKNQRIGKNRSCLRAVGTSGRGEVTGKGGRRVNTMQKMCLHAYKYKK